jgi:hypothetical protein
VPTLQDADTTLTSSPFEKTMSLGWLSPRMVAWVATVILLALILISGSRDPK